jgi:hypothetical protein
VLAGHRAWRIGAGQEGDDGVLGRGRDVVDGLHMVVFEIVVADLNCLRGTWDGPIRVLRVGDIVCGRRGDGGVLDVLWPRQGDG